MNYKLYANNICFFFKIYKYETSNVNKCLILSLEKFDIILNIFELKVCCMLLGYVFTSNCTQQVKAIHWPQFPMPFWAMSITFYAKGESVIAYCIRKYLISLALCRQYVRKFLRVTIIKPRPVFTVQIFK